MKTIIILSLLLTSLNCSAAFRFSSASSPSKAELDCIDQYHKLIEKNESVDCGHLDENKMKEASIKRKWFIVLLAWI